MKKIISLLTGIVFLVAIPNARASLSEFNDKTTTPKAKGVIVVKKNMKRVIILLRSIEIGDQKHLAMIDSNGNIDIDSLVTTVQPGTKIIWKLERLSGIIKINEIYPKEGEAHKIFSKDPKKRFLCKSFKLKLSKDAGEGRTDEIKEKYYIKYIHWDSTEVPIDPFIRIPPPPTAQ